MLMFSAGNPFMVQNDIGVRPAKRQIVIGGSEAIHYGTSSRHTAQPVVCRTQSFLLPTYIEQLSSPGSAFSPIYLHTLTQIRF